MNNSLKASFCEHSDESSGVAYICWGDCQNWHIGYIHQEATEMFGESEVGSLKRDDNQVLYFEFSDNVDFVALGNKIGVRRSTISWSSSSERPVRTYDHKIKRKL